MHPLVKTIASAIALGVLLTSAAFAQTPYLVSDLNTTFSFGLKSSNPTGFHDSGGTIYFTATADSTGTELWKFSNGQGSLVADIAPGSLSSSPGMLADIGNGVM